MATARMKVDGPSGLKTLALRSLKGREELGRPFEYALEVLSEDFDLDASRIIGSVLAVHVDTPEGHTRHFGGYVTSLETLGTEEHSAVYHVLLRPWLWLLSKTANCRVFQGLSVPQIVREVFAQYSFSDFEEALCEDYSAREFVVQYRESDLNFVTRLMEDEGIYFFFRHEATRHVMVLCDSSNSHAQAKVEVPLLTNDRKDDHLEHIDDWRVVNTLQPTTHVLKDFDFERPKAALVARHASQSRSGASFEVYDYPGGYTTTDQGETYARVGLELFESQEERFHASGNVRALSTGATFNLTQHPNDARNREYLVIQAEYALVNQELRSGASNNSEYFRMAFTSIKSSQPFRPPRITPRPRIHGAQTAIVVGKSGEEIWTDQYGRVKVKFHWDRSDDYESSSCWIRVAQLWAGGGWGGMHVPRIGQEVVVEFLEGDPDRPMVVGRVYNGANPVPYTLPANQTQSGIKSRSSPGAGPNNFNELRFEDKTGDELVFLQAERDYEALVKRDADVDVERDETRRVGRDRSRTVEGNETVVIEKDRSKTVINCELIAIGADRTATVGANESLDVGQARTASIALTDTLNVGESQTIIVGTDRSLMVGGDDDTHVSGSASRTVQKDESTDVGGNRTVNVQKNETASVSGKRTHSVDEDDALEIGKKLTVAAGEEITFRAGDATITLKKNGDIVLKGKNISIDGSGKIQLKASGNIQLKGAKVIEN